MNRERATGGGPYDTKDLADWRAEHRRALIEVEDETVSICIQSYPVVDDPKVHASHRGFVEREIRRRADVLLDETRDLRNDIRDGRVARLTRPVIQRGSFPPSLTTVMEEMRAAKGIDDVTGYDDDMVYKLHGAIYLLLLADLVAGDYTDPRVGPPMEAW